MKLNQIASALMVLSLSPMALADFTIQDIRVEGLQRTEPSTVFNYLPVKVGDNFNDARSEEIIKKLYATGFFDDVRVETMDNQVLLTVIERPTISSLNITGAKMLQNDAIKKNLEAFGLAQSQYFNQATLNQAVAGLKEEYLSRGKQSVQITPTVTKLARNRVSIDIAIEEGKSTKITDISFEGNEVYSDRRLMKQMSLSEVACGLGSRRATSSMSKNLLRTWKKSPITIKTTATSTSAFWIPISKPTKTKPSRPLK